MFVPPEFSCFPKLVQPEDKLPQWAATPVEFVYRLRRVLEALANAELVRAWIDRVWGIGRAPAAHIRSSSRSRIGRAACAAFCPASSEAHDSDWIPR
jgi:hypothetical protein